ncbi:MAG TPA: hypothetical protein VLW84_14130 [Terriglobales bacterium]|nr:hypothetical protein [Terriglobales bacterium]
MPVKRFWIPVSLILLILSASAAAQEEKNEVGVVIGRTFIADQGVQGVSTFDTNLHFGKGLTLEGDYARHLWGRGFFQLSGEVPVVINFDEKVHFSVNLVPKDYKSFFVTPSLRANMFATNAVSPWLSFGGGFGHFSENSQLEFFGPNPGQTGTTTSVIQFGGGLDVRPWKRLGFRGEVRDYDSGLPQLNVNTGKSRQHNLYVGGGIVWRF